MEDRHSRLRRQLYFLIPFALFLVAYFTIFDVFDLFRFVLILLSETIFNSYSIYVTSKLTTSEKWKERRKK